MSYIEWIELESFFSGYLLVYAIIYLAATYRPGKNFARNTLLPKLPLAYAFVATLYLGLQLKNGFPDYHLYNMVADFRFPYLKIWGLLSIFFWIPFLHRKAVFSLLHSLVFFFILMKSFYIHLYSPSADNDLARNSMKIYSVSILLNLGALILVTVVSLMMSRFKKQKRSTHI